MGLGRLFDTASNSMPKCPKTNVSFEKNGFWSCGEVIEKEGFSSYLAKLLFVHSKVYDYLYEPFSPKIRLMVKMNRCTGEVIYE